MRTEGALWLRALRSLEASLGHGIEGRGPGQYQQHLSMEDIGRMAFIPGNGHHGDKQPLLGMETPPHPYHCHRCHLASPQWKQASCAPLEACQDTRTLCSPERGNMVEGIWNSALRAGVQSLSSACQLEGYQSSMVTCALTSPLTGTEMTRTESVTHVISAWETVRHVECTAGHSTHPHATASSFTVMSCRQHSSWAHEARAGRGTVPGGKEGEARCGDTGLESQHSGE